MVERNRLHLLVEGQTEETITRDVITPYLESLGWLVGFSIVKTKRPAAGPAHRGGVTCWAHVERDLRLLLRDSSLALVTTLLDYYAFPEEAPGMANRPVADAVTKVKHVEGALAAAIPDRRFVPNLVLHETEAWVFAAHQELGDLYGDQKLARTLRRDVDTAGGPELVNDGPRTAPSKRLLRYHPGYLKTLDGPLAIADFGLPALRARCPHLDEWFLLLEGARHRA
jgi:hypothetical protein